MLAHSCDVSSLRHVSPNHLGCKEDLEILISKGNSLMESGRGEEAKT